MSLPIKSTPTLKGKDADKFLNDIAKNLEDSKKSPLKEKNMEAYKRAKKTYDAMRANGNDLDF